MRELKTSGGIALAVILAAALVACGAGNAHEAGAPATASAKGPGAAADSADAGSVGTAADAAPPGKPFAGSPGEAMQLIGTAIDQNASEVKKCVAEYRTRKKLPHQRVEISVGIDQEGRLLGASLKGNKQDTTFSDCAQRALANAPFPRSHAGVIQVTKSYEEIEQ